MADQPITGAYKELDAPEDGFDDARDDVYSYEKMRNEKTPYGQRTSELGVIDEGLQPGVKTLVTMSPTIYGVGGGEINKCSIQVPGYVKATLGNGQAAVVSEGNGVWDNVHVEDLAELYTLCVLIVLERVNVDLPTGKKGIIFSGTARHTWAERAQGVADAAYEARKIKTKEVKHVSLDEAAKIFTASGGDEFRIEWGLSSNSRTKTPVAKEKLGWKPRKGPENWKSGFAEEVKAAIEKAL
ncbi:hypothetical protein LTR74_017949 [Friedmanniomyces endolithicus]|nr:hypothetical protein LTR74_017949 [Friedmanniomyces endolithicus]